jgi:glycosyltransferase involved in cell wall biosynthesis
MIDLLVVAVEPPWPARQGGQVRVAGIVESLSSSLEVVVIAAGESNVPTPVPVLSVARAQKQGGVRHFFSSLPRIGSSVLGEGGIEKIRHTIHTLDPRAVLFTHSYLAACVGMIDRPTVIDFANIEVDRLTSVARAGKLKNRLSALWEAAKARRWEPKVALNAGLCIALSTGDLAKLKSWGARAELVLNGVEPAQPLSRSPVDGYALFLSSADYRPNRDAGFWVAEQVWPTVRAQFPSARLVLAGRGSGVVFGSLSESPGVDVIGEVESTEALFAGAAVVLAPVTVGGGQQLKVIEALAHGRVVIATEYSSLSVPVTLSDLCVVAHDSNSFSKAVANVLARSDDRWAREEAATSAVQELPDWRASVDPLLQWLGQLP